LPSSTFPTNRRSSPPFTRLGTSLPSAGSVRGVRAVFKLIGNLFFIRFTPLLFCLSTCFMWGPKNQFKKMFKKV
jgi:hypothetical protein